MNNLPRNNPFTPGTVCPPARFVGRTNDIKDILSLLTTMHSISLVGEARLGKTSLLTWLRANISLRLGETYLPLYFSMGTYPTPSDFSYALLELLLPHIIPPSGYEPQLRDIERHIQQGKPVLFRECVKVLEWASASNLRVVLLLDEFKDLLEYPAFDHAFRDQLRSLYIFSKVALVLATRQSIAEIEGLSAYFINGVIEKHLSLFSNMESRDLLNQSQDRPFPPEAVNVALEVANNHPLRLQLAGYKLYEWRGEPKLPFFNGAPIHPNAFNILNNSVNHDYQFMMRASLPIPVKPINRISITMDKEINNPIRWIGKGTRMLGEFISTQQDTLWGFVVVLGIITICLYLSGLLPYEGLRSVLCLLGFC